ncbi:glycosyltransferase [Consotaella aegiceratis]|uniref:glycosyltransferase n=1 Tax=Consotaella aegiceratis TaxID=3097961 RepID=UPI002F3EFF86
MAVCSVIIPFYQKQPEILSRALKSVFAQTFQDFQVLVVDDASPLPAEDELAGLAAEDRQRIEVIRQDNSGPGGARNTGLDHVAPETRFVAFLDSDDEWAPHHLENAVGAMTRFEADCYWDAIEGGSAFYYHFGMATVEEKTPTTRLSDDPVVLDVPNLAGVMLQNWSFMHMSCMVLGGDLFPKVRFEPSLRLAAEDVLFFYDCVRNARHPILCDAAGAYRGEGLNIFHSIDNSSPLFLRQQFNTWVALDNLARRFDHNAEDRASIDSYKRTARQQALWSQAAQFKRRKAPQWSLLAEWIRRDPKLLTSALELAAGKVMGHGRRAAPGQ